MGAPPQKKSRLVTTLVATFPRHSCGLPTPALTSGLRSRSSRPSQQLKKNVVPRSTAGILAACGPSACFPVSPSVRKEALQGWLCLKWNCFSKTTPPTPATAWPPAGRHHPRGGGQRDLFSGGREKKKHPKFLVFFLDVKPFSTCFRHDYFLFYDTVFTR